MPLFDSLWDWIFALHDCHVLVPMATFVRLLHFWEQLHLLMAFGVSQRFRLQAVALPVF
jgi:hypothetical protein